MFAVCFRYLFQQAALMSLLGVLTPIADAQPATCDEADSTCYTNQPLPARGEALLQHQAQREQSVPNSHVHKLFGSVIQVDETLTSSEDPEGSDSDKNSGNEDQLPAGAMELFNAKLCSIKPGSASSRSTAASRTAASSHSAESSHDDTRESSHDMRGQSKDDDTRESSHDDRRSFSAKHSDKDDNGKDEHNDRDDHGKEEHSDKDDRDDRDEHNGKDELNDKKDDRASLSKDASAIDRDDRDEHNGKDELNDKKHDRASLSKDASAGDHSMSSNKSDKSAQSSGKSVQKSNSKSTSQNQTGSGTKHASEEIDLTAGKSAGKSQLNSGAKDAHHGSQTVQLMSDEEETLSEGEAKRPDEPDEILLPVQTFSREFILQWKTPGKDGTAENAALDESGMKDVAAMKDDRAMKVFIRRVADSCSIKITQEGGLNGLVGYFIGKQNGDQPTMKELKEALFKALLAESKHHWAAVKSDTDTTGDTAPLDMIGYCQVRALRKSREMVRFVRRMVNNMGIKITDNGGFDGMMSFYSEPDDSGSFMRLMSEIKRAAYEHSWAELE
jgi:hypothetical protein